MRLGVLVSGQGSTLAAIRDHDIDISLVVADRQCPALHAARRQRIPGELVLRTNFTSTFEAERPIFTQQLLKVLKMYGIGIVVMAGFFTILSPPFFEYFKGKVLNIHPALLPDFKGPNAIRDTLAAGVEWTGSTVHIATEEVDSGPILAQSRVRIFPNDTKKTLHERLKAKEYELYPEAIKKFLVQLSTT